MESISKLFGAKPVVPRDMTKTPWFGV